MPDYKINKDFNRLFLQNEQRELYGSGYRNIIYLGLILLVTFLVLGFANGSMEYLKRKMDDPFIKWINIEVPHLKSDNIARISRELDSRMLKDSFRLEEINGYFQYTMFFLNHGGSGQFQALGRTIHHRNRILGTIGHKNNLVNGEAIFGEKDIGIIVTQDLLYELGYEKAPSHINMSAPTLSGIYAPAPIPVIAVVNQLPGRSHFVTTPYFYNKRKHSLYKPFDVRKEEYARSLEYFSPGNKESALELGKELLLTVEENGEWKAAILDLTVQEYNKSYQEGHLIRIMFDEDWATHDRVNHVANTIDQSGSRSEGLTRVYSYNLSGNEEPHERYDYLSVYFSFLDKIRGFQALMESDYELKIDMSQIESKENYNFVSNLTLIISIFLICFSILSIVFFIIKVLKSHIEKIRKNLGTFKAFGLSNTSLVRIYIYMASRFLLIACVVAFGISYLLGSSGFIRMLLSLFNTTLEGQQTYFDLLNWITYLTIPLIIVINGVIVRYSLTGILSRSPGDLIYSRD